MVSPHLHAPRPVTRYPVTSHAAADDGEAWAGDVERRQSLVDAAWHGQRLDRALVAMAGEFSRSHLQTLIENGHVAVDDQVVRTPARKCAPGRRSRSSLVADAGEPRLSRRGAAARRGLRRPARAGADKPAGLVVHPAAGNW